MLIGLTGFILWENGRIRPGFKRVKGLNSNRIQAFPRNILAKLQSIGRYKKGAKE
jgi:hypothetical protein